MKISNLGIPRSKEKSINRAFPIERFQGKCLSVTDRSINLFEHGKDTFRACLLPLRRVTRSAIAVLRKSILLIAFKKHQICGRDHGKYEIYIVVPGNRRFNPATSGRRTFSDRNTFTFIVRTFISMVIISRRSFFFFFLATESLGSLRPHLHDRTSTK